MPDKTIEDLKTDRETVQKALQLLYEGNSKKMVAKQVGTTRRSITNWSKWGILTDGESWHEYIEKKKALQKQESKRQELEVKSEKIQNYYDEVREDLRKALKRAAEDLASGEMSMRARDVQDLMDMLNRLDNRDEQLQSLLNRAMRSWFIAASEILGEDKFKKLFAKKKEVEVEMLEEMNPEAAKQLAEENEMDLDL